MCPERDRQRAGRKKVREASKGPHAAWTDSLLEAVQPGSRKILGGHELNLRSGRWTWELRQRVGGGGQTKGRGGGLTWGQDPKADGGSFGDRTAAHEGTSWPHTCAFPLLGPGLSCTHTLLLGQSVGEESSGRPGGPGGGAAVPSPWKRLWAVPPPEFYHLGASGSTRRCLLGPGTVSGATLCSAQQLGLTWAVQVALPIWPVRSLQSISIRPRALPPHSLPLSRCTTTSRAGGPGTPSPAPAKSL